MARIATFDDQREQFLELGGKWMSDAESIDQGIELRPKEAASASEMAGEAIDRLGDPLATDAHGKSASRYLSRDHKNSEIFARINWDPPDNCGQLIKVTLGRGLINAQP